MSIVKVLIGAALFVRWGVADTTFKSRPDLAPVKLNITQACPESGCAPGYYFVAPFNGHADQLNYHPAQPGPYILTDSGEVVWSGFTYYSPWNANFHASRWNGQDVLVCFEGRHNGPHGHGHGHHTFLSQHYDTIRELRAGGHYLSDKHEFIIVNEQTALIQIYQPVQRNLSEYGGTDAQTWVVDVIFQELDIQTGEVIFQWHSLDHVSPNDSKLPLPQGLAGTGHNSSTAWDYFHINSVVKGDDGHYLLSARHASTIFKINGTDGSIIWRVGGNRSDFKLGKDVEFGFQHHARYLPGGNDTVDLISLFDNSVYGSESNGKPKDVKIFDYSRGKYIALDHRRHEAKLVQAFLPPNNSILSKSQGSLQTIPGGNVLINWGSEGQITEYDPQGKILFHAHLDSGRLANNVQNYRAFKFNWTGYSPETPALVAHHDGGAVKLYVSWNGDTRVASWRFTGSKAKADGGKIKVFSKAATRAGFETVLEVPVSGLDIKSTTVSVEALGENGQVIARSQAVRITPAIHSSTGQ
ncbi:hypothetical protein HIM_06814 [Hirsutella minnesotensis 3608]|uniref:Arylsulfotransferase n=1 Tax=Hirsutella minnesotensis 3608 TaxID=1043627 RepID=A0A0F7ZIH2_9HYPO|nr:hypothetical protein HIM_06814 [Hirsutella minnesotensis 3608]